MFGILLVRRKRIKLLDVLASKFADTIGNRNTFFVGFFVGFLYVGFSVGTKDALANEHKNRDIVKMVINLIKTFKVKRIRNSTYI